MIFEIINPSDPYTMQTDNFLAGAIGIVMVGQGFGLRQVDGELETPVMFGWEQWLEKQGVPVNELESWLDEPDNAHAVADALDSVMFGGLSERELMSKSIEGMTQDELDVFRREHLKRHRSSMNNIGEACWDIAVRIRESLGGESQ